MSGRLSGLFIVDKGVGFLKSLLQIMGDTSIFIYGLAIIHFYTQSLTFLTVHFLFSIFLIFLYFFLIFISFLRLQ